MSETKNRVWYQIQKILVDGFNRNKPTQEIAEQILSIKELAIVDRSKCKLECEFYYTGEDMEERCPLLKAGYVKEEKDVETT